MRKNWQPLSRRELSDDQNGKIRRSALRSRLRAMRWFTATWTAGLVSGYPQFYREKFAESPRHWLARVLMLLSGIHAEIS